MAWIWCCGALHVNLQFKVEGSDFTPGNTSQHLHDFGSVSGCGALAGVVLSSPPPTRTKMTDSLRDIPKGSKY